MDKTIYADFYNQYKFTSLQDLMNTFPNSKPLRVSEAKWIMQLLSCSVFYRALLKNNSCDDVIHLLTEDAPKLLEQIDVSLLQKTVKEIQKSMSPYDIVCMDCNESITINGKTFNGIKDIKRQWQEQKTKQNQTILAAYDRFPCFDSSDYAYENRYYWNFWFLEYNDFELVKQLIDSQSNDSDYCYLTEKLPGLLIPMVYYKDESEVMLVAKRSDTMCSH